ISLLAPLFKGGGKRLYSLRAISLVIGNLVTLAVHDAILRVANLTVDNDNLSVGEQIDTIFDDFHLEVAGCDGERYFFSKSVGFDNCGALQYPDGNVIEFDFIEDDLCVFTHPEIRPGIEQELNSPAGPRSDNLARGNSRRRFDRRRTF